MKDLICTCALVIFISLNIAAQEATTLSTPTGDIYGTLLMPASENPVPVVLIIAGSGPTDRNGNQPSMNNNSLKMLAEGLRAEGIASLCFDKRGIAESKTALRSESEITFEIYIEDARLWIDQLAKDKRFSQIVVAGHSEGSLIGMIAAENNPKVTKYVSIAGTGVPLDQTLKEQLSKQLANQPANVKEATFSMIDKLKKGEKIESVEPRYYALFRPSIQPYLISVFKYDPCKEISKLTIPVLVLQGTTDIQISTSNADLLSGSNKNSKKIFLENVNHVLKDCTGKDIQSQMPLYTNPETPINKQLVKEIAKFILEDTTR